MSLVQIQRQNSLPLPGKLFSHPTPGELAFLREQALRAKAYARGNPVPVIFGTVVFFAFAASVFLFSLASVPASASASAAEPSTLPAVTATAGGVRARPLELHIAQNGLVLLRSARIVAISGSALTVSTAWGSADFSWIVNTNASHYEGHDFGTKFLTRDGQPAALSDFRVGDLVTITGNLDPDAQEPTVQAGAVRLSQ